MNSQQFLSAASSFSSLHTVNSDVVSNAASTLNDITQPSQNANNWVRVQRRRRNRQPVVFGTNDTDDLQVVVQKKWVHLSSFKSSVTCDQILNYVDKHSEFGKEHMECYALVKQDAQDAQRAKNN